MKVVLNIRHRPRLQDSIEQRAHVVEERLRTLPAPWGLVDDAVLSLPAMGTKLAVDVKLRGKLGKGLTGQLTFRYRAAANLQDMASHDDFLIVEFDSAKVPWAMLTNQGFPGYLRVMDAYLGRLAFHETMGDEWEIRSAIVRSTRVDLDGRDGLFRIGPLSYMDREVCRRSCNGLEPEEVAARIKRIGIDVRLIQDGLFIVGGDDYPAIDSVVQFDHDVRAALGVPSPAAPSERPMS